MKTETITSRHIARELARQYSTMTKTELDVLESMLIPMKYNKNSIIFNFGEVSEHICYIEKGIVRQYYYKNNKELTASLAADGDIVMSVESLFKETPTRFAIEAIEACKVWLLPKKELEKAALHIVNIQMLYAKMLEGMLIRAQIHADLVRFETALSRYEKFTKLMPLVAMRTPLTLIANYLQMTPETLSRIRASYVYK